MAEDDGAEDVEAAGWEPGCSKQGRAFGDVR